MSQIPASTSAPPAPPALKSRFNEMSSEEFMKIIFTELQQQDPFKPNDSSALLEQLNSIRSIESDIEMGERLEAIVFQNQLASAGNLIGKRVGGLSTENNRVGGVVKSVSRVGDEIGLLLHNNWVIPMENVEYIDDETMPAPAPAPGG
jgi:flagellar basal-body rod modification protein FlgD